MKSGHGSDIVGGGKARLAEIRSRARPMILRERVGVVTITAPLWHDDDKATRHQPFRYSGHVGQRKLIPFGCIGGAAVADNGEWEGPGGR
jgi:hypothetical protein